MRKTGIFLAVLLGGLVFSTPLFALGIVSSSEENSATTAQSGSSGATQSTSSSSSFSTPFSLYRPSLGTHTTMAGPSTMGTEGAVGASTQTSTGTSSKSFKMGQMTTASSPSSQAQVQ